MFEWHRNKLNQMMNSLKIDSYQVAWNSFFKGFPFYIIGISSSLSSGRT
jgi:hypothetical protein